ncbi:endonuclease [Pseudomonas phage vB_PF_Y1-MI]|nr:endonuclease [Pseudomonas phage vB_PF_Y1-MI]
MSYFLYCITNKVNGKRYIGITNNPAKRRKQHLSWKGQPSSPVLRSAVEKYGSENFSFEVLVEGSKDYINELEVSAIAHYGTIAPNGYNLQSGGSPDRGSKVEYRSDDKPICAMGFWFPNNRTAITALGINSKTFYKWRKEGTLHLEARQLKAKVRPKRGSLEDIQNRSQSMKLTLKIKAGNVTV